MIRNYFKITWRNIAKSKVYSLINILGLSVGMAVAMLIGMWIWDELSYNKSFPNYDHLAKLMENSTTSGVVNSYDAMPIPLADELRTKFKDDFKLVALASWNSAHVISYRDKKLAKDGVHAQEQLPQILTLKMRQGTRNGLADPSSIMLSKSLADAIFGSENPLNKIIKLDNRSNLKVTGVFEDFAYNSDFRDWGFLVAWGDYVASNSWVKNAQQDWDDNSWEMFVQLADHSEAENVSAKIKNTLQGHDRKDKPEAFLHPMNKWHLYTEFKNGKNTGGRIQYIWLFGTIGLFILLLACINFMNLSTARSEKRAKEVGIRKAIGSLRKQLVIQFLSESVATACFAFLFALVLVQLSLHGFNQLADKHMQILWADIYFWIFAIGFTLFTGLVSGSYPALFMSAFNPVSVLKGTFKAGRFSSVPRKVMVILQFTISVTLIIGTIIVYKQILFAKDRTIGYDREGLIMININPDLFGHYESLRNDLISSGAVENMSESSSPATAVWSNQSGFDWKGKDPNMLPSFGVIAVTHDYGKTVGWQFVAGRDFSRDFSSDTASVILNEAAVRFMGLKNPVGEILRRVYQKKNYRIVGVIRNMIMESPFDPIKPTIFLMDYEWANIIFVKLNPMMSRNKSLAKIETVFKKYDPGSPFDFKFAEGEYARKFEPEERISKLATFFALLAIFISCLGLFGLASFVAEQRTKEIGVRKVLGASVLHVWSLLSKDFLLLICISFLIAIPVSIFLMNHWLGNYAYRTRITWWVFAAVGLGTLLITMITVSFQAIKAAVANPVMSLRTE